MDINTGLIVGNAPDLTGLSSGKYQLLTSNSTCNLATKVIAVGKAGFDPIKVASINATDAHCDANNGSINSIQFEKNSFAYRFEWKNAGGASISNTPLFANAAPGNYRLLATDSNQCSGEVYTHTLKLFSTPSISYDNIKSIADTCSFGKGAITGISAGGGAGSYSWSWLNAAGNKVSADKNIYLLPAGTYYATVADSFNCTVKGRSIQVTNASVTWPSPVAANGEVLKGNSATIQVQNPIAGLYLLFDNSSAVNRLAFSYDGMLKTPAVTEDRHFFIRYDSGSCKSALTDVVVRVITQKDIMVPNGFTPNKDGHNDQFRPLLSRQPEKYQFMIYSRWGRKIFESTEPGKGWNGMMDQLPAEAGTYVWVCSYQLPGEPPQTLKGSVVLVR
jgi:gliding motility-associated-like protein